MHSKKINSRRVLNITTILYVCIIAKVPVQFCFFYDNGSEQQKYSSLETHNLLNVI